MEITIQKFITIRLNTGGSQKDLEVYCSSALVLVEKYGNGLFTKATSSVIRKFDESLLVFLEILRNIKKATPESIKEILSLLDYQKEGQWKIATSHPEKVKNLKKGAEIIKKDNTGLMIQGDGKIYKRILDRDIDILLK